MKLDRGIRNRLTVVNALTIGLILAAAGLLAWLSLQYETRFDWTHGARNTLSEASRGVLGTLDGDLAITAFATEDEALRGQIAELVSRYRQVYPELSLQFVNPDTAPDRVRELGISVNGELVIAYRGREDRVDLLSEENLTNAIQRVAQDATRRVLFVTGHGERSPEREANHDLSVFATELGNKGIISETIHLAVNPVPDDTSALVIAGPRTQLLDSEIARILAFVQGGGHLLWLGDPGTLSGLEPLAEAIGIEFLPGTVVDATTQMFGIQDPALALAIEYPRHAINDGFFTMTLFPRSTALAPVADSGWDYAAFIETLPDSWTETGPIEGEIRLDDNEQRGPLVLGAALTRDSGADQSGGTQRIAVIGDGDFLSNTYLANGGNLELGMNIMYWLLRDEQFLSIPPRTAPDRNLVLSERAQIAIGFGFLFALPGLLLATGVWIWLRRRRVR